MEEACLPEDMGDRIALEVAVVTAAVEMLRASVCVLNLQHPEGLTADLTHAFLVEREDAREFRLALADRACTEFLDGGTPQERERGEYVRSGLAFFYGDWQRYAYTDRREQIIRTAISLLSTVTPEWTVPLRAIVPPPELAEPMSLSSLQAWLDNPSALSIAAGNVPYAGPPPVPVPYDGPMPFDTDDPTIAPASGADHIVRAIDRLSNRLVFGAYAVLGIVALAAAVRTGKDARGR
jgi:hypothetical protein